MVWQLYALISAFSFGFQRIIHAHVMKTEDYIAYSWLSSLLTSIFFLALFFADISIPISLYAWSLALFAGLLWTTITMMGFKSYQLTPLSLIGPLSKVDVLFSLTFSVLILQEVITIIKVLGTVFIFIGLIILTWRKGKFFGRFSDKGVKLTLLVALFHGIVSVVDKAAVVYFLPVFYGFLEYFLVPLYLMPLAIKNSTNIKKLILNKKFLPVVGAILSVTGYYSSLSAYMLTDVSNVFPVTQLSTVISIVGGFHLFKEKERLPRIIGSIIMIMGSIMILKSY